MPTVRLEDDVFQALKKLAEPFVDTPSTVVRRLLEEKGLLARTPAAPQARGAALTPQPVFEAFLLQVLARQFGGKGHKREVTNAVVEQMQHRGVLVAADLELVSTGETKAENTIAWGRNALKERGLIARVSPRGIWELTAEGRKAAEQVVLPKRA